MRRVVFFVLLVSGGLIAFPRLLWASPGGDAATPVQHGLEPLVLVGVAIILIVAKLSGELFERLGQPAVLGELIGGIIAGNLALIGFGGIEFLKNNEVIG